MRNWAKGVRTELFSPTRYEEPAIVRMRLLMCAIENEWVIITTARIFGEEFQKIVEKAAKDLWAYIDALVTTKADTTIDHTLYTY